MNIGLDMDEILAEFVDGFLQFHNDLYGTTVRKQEMPTYHFEDVVSITKDQMEERLLQFYKTDYFQNIKLVSGAEKGIDELAKSHKLAVITARPYIIKLETERWLNQYFSNCFASINLTNQFQYRNQGIKRKKSEVGKERGIEIMVEDNLKHADDCASQGIPVLLLNYPWNRNVELPENIKRVHSWEEIVAEINNYGKNNGRRNGTKKI